MFSTKSPSLRVDEKDLKCKNNCGYFGNPVWDGYCSKCHKYLPKKIKDLSFVQEKERLDLIFKFRDCISNLFSCFSFM